MNKAQFSAVSPFFLPQTRTGLNRDVVPEQPLGTLEALPKPPALGVPLAGRLTPATQALVQLLHPQGPAGLPSTMPSTNQCHLLHRHHNASLEHEACPSTAQQGLTPQHCNKHTVNLVWLLQG